jgi:hypothetical protein
MPNDYSAREDLGIIRATSGLEWCVLGLDWAYNSACKIVRPSVRLSSLACL